MKQLSVIEEQVFNQGERLIPGVTHDAAEVIRHKSSYQFFRKIIESDLIAECLTGRVPIRILDLGCGVGHGTHMLADIPRAIVTGIDSSEHAIKYARTNYSRENITYRVADAVRFLESMPEFDYVVSRHVLEHIPNGIAVAATCKYAARLMVNVPFDESDGNPHHHVHFLREDSFADYKNPEILYEGLTGVTYCERPENRTINSIICISSRLPFPKVKQIISFPVPAWQPEFLQGRWLKVFDEIGDHESEIQALQSRLNEAHRTASSLQAELERTHQSVSWRVTAPLRAGRRALGVLLRRFRSLFCNSKPGLPGPGVGAQDRAASVCPDDRSA